MTTFNIVRFRIKPGMDQEFLEAHGSGKAAWPGLKTGVIVKTGDNAYCLIGEWSDAEALVSARPRMIATLDTFRRVLEPTASGVTDAVSGPVVMTLT
jgi:hypothetical protein